MSRHDDLALELLELTLRMERLRAALGGPTARILDDEERAAIESALEKFAQEARRMEAELRTLSGPKA